jgi:hypothetical protein
VAGLFKLTPTLMNQLREEMKRIRSEPISVD